MEGRTSSVPSEGLGGIPNTESKIRRYFVCHFQYTASRLFGVRVALSSLFLGERRLSSHHITPFTFECNDAVSVHDN